MSWVAIVVLVAMLALVALHPDLRRLAANTWREMLSISPPLLALIFGCKVGQALFSSLAWWNLLRLAWPYTDISYRFVLGIEQGQVALNTVAPARVGTWVMLGIFKASIREARVPKLLAVWGVQSLAFGLFATINYALVAVGLPDRIQGRGGIVDRVSRVADAHPLLVAVAGAVIGIFAVAAFVVGRRKAGEIGRQIRDGVAILRTPGTYLRLVFAPSLVSYLFGCAAYALLLAAFDIPVSIWTLALALSSNALAGAVRITPGGVGTSQALDVVALRDYAPVEVVTAYSLSELAITTVASLVIAVVALLSVHGWHGTRTLLVHLCRGEFARGVHTLSAHQRGLRARAMRRRPKGRAAPPR